MSFHFSGTCPVPPMPCARQGSTPPVSHRPEEADMVTVPLYRRGNGGSKCLSHVLQVTLICKPEREQGGTLGLSVQHGGLPRGGNF